MASQRIEVQQEFSESPEEMFSFLADHHNLTSVFGVPVKRIVDGRDDVNGVGSVRSLGFAPLAAEETVTAMEKNKSIDYRITRGGGPIRNHRGRLVFSKTATGSRVEWIITFDSLPVLGTVLAKALEFGISRGLKKIA